jgi:hypothetical protein
MPLPLIPIISALATGSSLVPHAAGGLIVTGASGYITGLFLVWNSWWNSWGQPA